MSAKLVLVHGLSASDTWFGETPRRLANALSGVATVDVWQYRSKISLDLTSDFLDGLKEAAILTSRRSRPLRLESLDDLGKRLLGELRTGGPYPDGLLLLGHSMGGLVVASALGELTGEDEIAKSVRGAALFCSPIEGTKKATLAAIWSKLITLGLAKPNVHIEFLDRESEQRQKLMNRFYGAVDTWLKDRISVFRAGDDEVIDKADVWRASERRDTHVVADGHSSCIRNLPEGSANLLRIVRWAQECLGRADTSLRPYLEDCQWLHFVGNLSIDDARAIERWWGEGKGEKRHAAIHVANHNELFEDNKPTDQHVLALLAEAEQSAKFEVSSLLHKIPIDLVYAQTESRQWRFAIRWKDTNGIRHRTTIPFEGSSSELEKMNEDLPAVPVMRQPDGEVLNPVEAFEQSFAWFMKPIRNGRHTQPVLLNLHPNEKSRAQALELLVQRNLEWWDKQGIRLLEGADPQAPVQITWSISEKSLKHAKGFERFLECLEERVAQRVKRYLVVDASKLKHKRYQRTLDKISDEFNLPHGPRDGYEVKLVVRQALDNEGVNLDDYALFRLKDSEASVVQGSHRIEGHDSLLRVWISSESKETRDVQRLFEKLSDSGASIPTYNHVDELFEAYRVKRINGAKPGGKDHDDANQEI